MAGYVHPRAAERAEMEREERINARLKIANRAEALRNVLRERYDANPTAGAVESTLEVLDAIIDDTPLPHLIRQPHDGLDRQPSAMPL